MKGEEAEKILKDRVLKLLPAGPGVHDAGDACKAVEDLKKTPICKFADDHVRGQVGVLGEALQAISQKRLPTIDLLETTEMLKECKAKLPFYMHHEVKVQGMGKTLNGKEAIDQKYQETAARMAAGTAVDGTVLNDFHTFNWLLEDNQKRSHDKWCEVAFQAAAKAQPSKAGAKSKTTAKAKEKAKAKAAKAKKRSDEQGDLFS